MKRMFRNPFFTAVTGAFLAFAASYYVFYISDYRTMLDQHMSEVRNGVQEVEESLRELSDVATGRIEKSSESVVQFDTKITNLYSRAAALSGLLPETNNEFVEFKNSMLELQNRVHDLSGPLDARGFVESTSRWHDARLQFDSKVESVRSQFIPFKMKGGTTQY